MPALKSFSAAEEEDDQLCPNPEADRYKSEAEEEEEEDPDQMDEKDEDDNEGGDEEVEDDVTRDEEEEEEVEAEDEEALDEEDSKERSQSSTSEELSESEYMDIELGDIRRDVQCPICLGIIKKTRTVMECLHRFCRECIDKSMRLGNNECPACRKHCASRRSLRDDPKFDAFIAALFKNIDRFEEEELACHEDELARRKQIQVSIAQVSQRQSEALVKRRSFGKDAGVLPRPQRIGSGSRRRRNYRNMEQNTPEADDDDDDNNNRGKDSSSDEPCAEILLRKRKRRSTTRSTAHPSSSCQNNNDICANKGTEEAHHRDSRGISPGLVWNPEILAWGRGGTRSNTRQGNNNQGASSKSVRNARLNRLVEYLGSLESNSGELDIHLKLISLDTKCIPNLPQPYLCCRPTLLVKQLRKYVALQMQLKTEEVELLVSKEDDRAIEGKTSSSSTERLQSIQDDETLAKLRVDCISSHGYLMVVCRQKQIG
ncbi:hypothetical protein EUTSA_v10007494mg [Eutrema salsugineum]|uniref:RING-type domain-containing protein n=1 Tax=Eutrema salsugineum TaxID=72664 RepID=V4L9Y2_EUTSA|nr:putative E3 ubiquitin-protein ligase RING1b [Eutrema salsugineum]ESQ36558.1 hypothetical protein EUTSA_v10007494mg [Eutrema salsugineum]